MSSDLIHFLPLLRFLFDCFAQLLLDQNQKYGKKFYVFQILEVPPVVVAPCSQSNHVTQEHTPHDVAHPSLLRTQTRSALPLVQPAGLPVPAC